MQRTSLRTCPLQDERNPGVSGPDSEHAQAAVRYRRDHERRARKRQRRQRATRAQLPLPRTAARAPPRHCQGAFVCRGRTNYHCPRPEPNASHPPLGCIVRLRASASALALTPSLGTPPRHAGEDVRDGQAAADARLWAHSALPGEARAVRGSRVARELARSARSPPHAGINVVGRATVTGLTTGVCELTADALLAQAQGQ